MILAKQPYAKRLKQAQKRLEEWNKKQERAKKRGEPYDSIMPKGALEVKLSVSLALTPDQNVEFSFTTPLAVLDTSKVHLYSKQGTLWYVSPFEIGQQRDTSIVPFNDAYIKNTRNHMLRDEQYPDIEYSLELDSAAFVDIYGKASNRIKQGLKVKSNDEFSTILLIITGADGKPLVVQLLDNSDKPVRQVRTSNGMAQLFYVEPREYYMRLFIDASNNGKWDTGDHDKGVQLEEVCYYPKKIACRAKWDFNETWNPMSTPICRQKPTEITKQKGEKQHKIQSRNAKRALDLGKEYTPGMMK